MIAVKDFFVLSEVCPLPRIFGFHFSDNKRLQKFLAWLGDLSTKSSLYNVEPWEFRTDADWLEAMRFSVDTALHVRGDVTGGNFLLFCHQRVALQLLKMVSQNNSFSSEARQI